MSKITDALDKAAPMEEAALGDEQWKGKHLTCRLCFPEATKDDEQVALCGAMHVCTGVATSTVAAWANEACGECLSLTSVHVENVHPELVE